MKKNPFEKIEQSVSNLFESLRALSDQIIQVETLLRKRRVAIPFTYNISPTISLEWQFNGTCKAAKSRGFRLYARDPDNGVDRALIETPIEVRLKFIPHLYDFLDAFAQHLDAISAETQNAYKNLKPFTIEIDSGKEESMVDEETLEERILKGNDNG